MRILTPERINQEVDQWIQEDWAVRYIRLNRGHWEDIAPIIAEAQAKETCKEIGEMLLDKWDELSERDFIVWMNGVIEVLVRGEIPESEMPARLIKDASEVTGIWDGFDLEEIIRVELGGWQDYPIFKAMDDVEMAPVDFEIFQEGIKNIVAITTRAQLKKVRESEEYREMVVLVNEVAGLNQMVWTDNAIKGLSNRAAEILALLEE